jgi:hypothetical protein
MWTPHVPTLFLQVEELQKKNLNEQICAMAYIDSKEFTTHQQE